MHFFCIHSKACLLNFIISDMISSEIYIPELRTHTHTRTHALSLFCLSHTYTLTHILSHTHSHTHFLFTHSNTLTHTLKCTCLSHLSFLSLFSKILITSCLYSGCSLFLNCCFFICLLKAYLTFQSSLL